MPRQCLEELYHCKKWDFLFPDGTFAAELSQFGRPLGHCSLFSCFFLLTFQTDFLTESAVLDLVPVCPSE